MLFQCFKNFLSCFRLIKNFIVAKHNQMSQDFLDQNLVKISIFFKEMATIKFSRNNLKQFGVVTIGGFDGVHLGHQQLLRQTVACARKLKMPATVVTFEPQPKEYFGLSKVRLTTWSEKLLLLKILGVDQVLCLRFDAKFAKLTSDDFIQQILIEKLKVHHLVVGEDFRFGFKQSGDVKLLQQHGARDFVVEVVADFLLDGILVKSTAIREALIKGDCALAARLLGRPYTIIGRVAHGDQRGRLLGFPTANIYLSINIAPLRGVYAARVYVDEEVFWGSANIGFRPTIGGSKHVLEVNLLDFERDIYGKRIKVEFIHKLRDEKKFDSLELLRQQIEEDVEQVKLRTRN